MFWEKSKLTHGIEVMEGFTRTSWKTIKKYSGVFVSIMKNIIIKNEYIKILLHVYHKQIIEILVISRNMRKWATNVMDLLNDKHSLLYQSN